MNRDLQRKLEEMHEKDLQTADEMQRYLETVCNTPRWQAKAAVFSLRYSHPRNTANWILACRSR